MPDPFVMAPPSTKSTLPMIAAFAAILIAAIIALVFAKETQLISAMTLLIVALAGAFHYASPPARTTETAQPNEDQLARGIVQNRTEIIDAMAILQQEIRLLQGLNAIATEKKSLREEIAGLQTEVAALKRVVASK